MKATVVSKMVGANIEDNTFLVWITRNEEGEEMMNSEYETKDLEVEILKHNIRKMKVMNQIFTIVIVIIMLVINFLSLFPSLQFPQNAGSHLGYILLLVFHLVIYSIFRYRKIHLTPLNNKKMAFFINFYVTFSLSLAALVSIKDLTLYNPFLIYTFILFTCSSFLILKAKQFLLPLIISSFILLIGLYSEHGEFSVSYLQWVYIAILLPTAFLLSRSHYVSFEKNFYRQLEMLKERNHTRSLTEKLKEANDQLELQTLLDPLTNLYNRRAYNEYLEKLQLQTLQSPILLSVVMIDVDCFKLYNDTYGHMEGDNVLIQIGILLKELSEQWNCFTTRWGGEEFILLLTDVSEQQVDNICQKIQDGVSNLNIHHRSSTISSTVTVSIGACTKRIYKKEEITHCINEADAALYYIKQHGRNNYEHRSLIHVP
ncbi:GGDEF domain-containing protein [Lysinibacillus halotolerans]|uniref:GGDEF domain-containing protein n=1 Tax=Lysinibacillus halotolerans TaxID=1368476 RepID=A0A3M8HAG0_9BACI|nr:GGDEF domain-containing protein [Lysinibacillus halotolerans]RNC99392.1 GGDEF domain-containing protein [Lysinibacillus halotolerans]